MTVGYDQPFMAPRLGEGEGSYSVGGVMRTVQVRGIRSYDLRFGIGGEYPIGPIAPFVDLIGSVRWVGTTLAIDYRRAGKPARAELVLANRIP